MEGRYLPFRLIQFYITTGFIASLFRKFILNLTCNPIHSIKFLTLKDESG